MSRSTSGPGATHLRLFCLMCGWCDGPWTGVRAGPVEFLGRRRRRACCSRRRCAGVCGPLPAACCPLAGEVARPIASRSSMGQPAGQVCRAGRHGGCPPVRQLVQVVGGPRACAFDGLAHQILAFDGLAHQMVGWRIGFRGANPPSRRSAHEMCRSGQVLADTQRGRRGPEPVGADKNRWARTRSGGRGPEPVGGDRTWWVGTGRGGWGPEVVGGDRKSWVGTGSRGWGPEVVGWDKELPVAAHDDLSQVTRGGPTRGEQARPKIASIAGIRRQPGQAVAENLLPLAHHEERPPPRVLQHEPGTVTANATSTPGRRSPTHRAGEPHLMG